MSTVPTLNGQVIGQAHYATRALLERAVAPLGVEFNQVLVLNILANGPAERAQLTQRITSTLKVHEPEVRRVLATLVDANLVEVDPDAATRLRLTDAGHAVQARIADAVVGISARMYAGIPTDEASAAARVLTLVTQRANAELAATPT
ncbi:MarR family winged helix-turn-helix transcriptional regulator [Micromonospora sp. NPDC050276]|uniref:MarR family winged helix-turn-helix transcriptional regulator n=1 Tax=Micromonospora sp. NPDC050276 TaxID=3364278 RepID=UPI00379FC412